AARGGPPRAASQPAAAPAPAAAPGKRAATQAPATAATQAPAAAAGNAVTSVKVGAAVGLTGRYASGGEQIKNGYELAVKDINSSGGAMGEALGGKLPLEINILDDASDANQTAQRLETLINSGILG